MFILWLTGVVFVATEGTMFWFLWKYNAQANREPVKYTHGSHNLEIVWTILPAVTLLFIAIYQMNAWADSKMRNPCVSPRRHPRSERRRDRGAGPPVRMAAPLPRQGRQARHARRSIHRERYPRAGQ